MRHLGYVTILGVLGLAGGLVSGSGKPADKPARDAVSTDRDVAERAIAQLRSAGPAGLERLWAEHRQAIEAHRLGGSACGRPDRSSAWSRLRAALDGVGGQRDGYASRLYWYTDLAAAQVAAAATGKPILSLRMLGKLTDEYSCANSRFFRTVLYANAGISDVLRRDYILHWQSVRSVPVLTVDFGDGRVLRRTITGNSIHYVLDSSGRIVDALPGLYGPQAFLDTLGKAYTAAVESGRFDDDSRLRVLASYYRERISDIDAQVSGAKAFESTPIVATSATLESDLVADSRGRWEVAMPDTRTTVSSLLYVGGLQTPQLLPQGTPTDWLNVRLQASLLTLNPAIGLSLTAPPASTFTVTATADQLSQRAGFVSRQSDDSAAPERGLPRISRGRPFPRARQAMFLTFGKCLVEAPLMEVVEDRFTKYEMVASWPGSLPKQTVALFPPDRVASQTNLTTRNLVDQMAEWTTTLALPTAQRGVPPLRTLTAGAGIPIARPLDKEDLAALAESPANTARLDAASVALLHVKQPESLLAAVDAMVASFERDMAADTAQNEYVFHRQLYTWLLAGAAEAGLDSLNERVYAELFLTPLADPWMGLSNPGVYTAIEDDGRTEPPAAGEFVGVVQ